MSTRGFHRRLTAPGLVLLAAVALIGASCNTGPEAAPLGQETQLQLPEVQDALRFAVIGDTGTGGAAQQAVAATMEAVHEAFPFDLVLMVGDNLYGSQRPRDYLSKFEQPYAPLLDAGVTFYASLGNHDQLEQRLYENFNMGGDAYYSFSPDGQDVRFFALYSDYLDPKQLEWLEQELADSDESWKIVFFHHPLYSSGGFHGPSVQLRQELEPLFVRYGVDVVFSGHEHFYERLTPQKGIHYFIVGNSAKLRYGDVHRDAQMAAAYDEGYAFLVAEIAGPNLFFQVIQSSGATVDSGSVQERTWRAEHVATASGDTATHRNRP